ncbi:hypothetical protein EYF80_059606 [Liparis tanakae]|uniref:Uncharacterized protein n=1 Tax=Liparis tanakae TaxID=230148 RepID=A0A4Z2EPI8_9TELE|nr:hypothetical protein EYF80_059606 [Liparis tanakae]
MSSWTSRVFKDGADLTGGDDSAVDPADEIQESRVDEALQSSSHDSCPIKNSTELIFDSTSSVTSLFHGNQLAHWGTMK